MNKICILVSAIAISIIFSSCSKNELDPVADEQHLLSVILKYGTDSNRFNYHYDPNGRLVQVTNIPMNQAEYTFADITYGNNEIKIVKKANSVPGITWGDTIYLFTNGDTLVAKRVSHAYHFHDAPYNVDRHYFYDTTNFQYNAMGVFMSAAYSKYDSLWYNPSAPQTSVKKTTGTITYVMSGQNLMHVTESNNSVQVEVQPPNTHITKSGTEATRAYDYSQAYPNKTDFTNSIVLNEVNVFLPFPINHRLGNLPAKEDFVFKIKDENGNVTNTFPSQSIYTYTYNADGLLETITNSNSPTGITRCVYGK